MAYPDITTSFSTLSDGKDRYRASHINAVQTAVESIITEMAPPQQTVVVAKARGDYTGLSDAATAITDATANKPYCIVVSPGIYETTEVTLPDYVSLVGLDSKSCILKSTTAETDYVIQSGDYSLIANLGVENNGAVSTTTESSCILVDADTCDIRDCELLLTLSSSTNSARASALYLQNSASCNIWSSDIAVTSTLSGTSPFSYGIHAESSTINSRLITVNISPVDGGGYGVLVDSGSTGVVYSSDITGTRTPVYYSGTITCDGCYMEATANNSYPVFVIGNNGYFYDCTMIKHGTATSCIQTSTTPNIRVAHCRMNLAAGIHTDIVNLIGTPYNVQDVDV